MHNALVLWYIHICTYTGPYSGCISKMDGFVAVITQSVDSDLHDIGKESGLWNGEEVQELDHLVAMVTSRRVLGYSERDVRPSVNPVDLLLG